MYRRIDERTTDKVGKHRQRRRVRRVAGEGRLSHGALEAEANCGQRCFVQPGRLVGCHAAGRRVIIDAIDNVDLRVGRQRVLRHFERLFFEALPIDFLDDLMGQARSGERVFEAIDSLPAVLEVGEADDEDLGVEALSRCVVGKTTRRP